MKLLNNFTWFSCLLIACIHISACGGSGSGGFDSPTMVETSFKAEQSVIAEVTREGGTGECVKTEDTLICPTDARLPAEVVRPDTPGQASERASLSIISHQSRDSVNCVRTVDKKLCKLTVRMSPKGFPRETRFMIASHLKGSSTWRLGFTFKPILSGSSIFEALVHFKQALSKDEPRLQIVVLVYLPDKALPQTDTLEPLLSRFQANAVFVVAGLRVQVVGVVGRISGDLIPLR